jgi:hypothetical protein
LGHRLDAGEQLAILVVQHQMKLLNILMAGTKATLTNHSRPLQLHTLLPFVI